MYWFTWILILVDAIIIDYNVISNIIFMDIKTAMYKRNLHILQNDEIMILFLESHSAL